MQSFVLFTSYFGPLIFLQLFGLSPVTGILAITIPYAGIIAKVYAEILEEADPTPLQALPAGTARISAFVFVRLPDAFAHFRSYSMYRLECGLRSSAVLGFIGLPTLGFIWESAFKEGSLFRGLGPLNNFLFCNCDNAFLDAAPFASCLPRYSGHYSSLGGRIFSIKYSSLFN